MIEELRKEYGGIVKQYSKCMGRKFYTDDYVKYLEKKLLNSGLDYRKADQQSVKRDRFIELAKHNQTKFEKHNQTKREVFGDIDSNHLKTIFDNGAIDDLFSLKLIEYVDTFNR